MSILTIHNAVRRSGETPKACCFQWLAMGVCIIFALNLRLLRTPCRAWEIFFILGRERGQINRRKVQILNCTAVGKRPDASYAPTLIKHNLHMQLDAQVFHFKYDRTCSHARNSFATVFVISYTVPIHVIDTQICFAYSAKRRNHTRCQWSDHSCVVAAVIYETFGQSLDAKTHNDRFWCVWIFMAEIC